jgi:hypothetical protein
MTVRARHLGRCGDGVCECHAWGVGWRLRLQGFPPEAPAIELPAVSAFLSATVFWPDLLAPLAASRRERHRRRVDVSGLAAGDSRGVFLDELPLPRVMRVRFWSEADLELEVQVGEAVTGVARQEEWVVVDAGMFESVRAQLRNLGLERLPPDAKASIDVEVRLHDSCWCSCRGYVAGE